MDNNLIIIKVEANSIGEELGINSGDELISINDKPIKDVFDYRYLINDEYIEITIKKASGEIWILEVDKAVDEDLGFVFESGLMCDAKSCKNNCIFCFIDQLPKGMRDTLYFKDDDSRLSFLQGNYITLTNMVDKDIERIIFYHLSPINISVHTTDLKLRKKMLKNPNAILVLDYIKKLFDANIEMNFQIVLCNGINDGEALNKSIEDLSEFLPTGKSLSIVPVGITKYREENNLFKLTPFSKEQAKKIIEQVEFFQKKLKKQYDNNFVFCSDEFYLTAELAIPLYESYEDFPQIENGVGMIASMKHEFYEKINSIDLISNKKIDSISNKKKLSISNKKKVSIATGVAAYDFICQLCEDLCKKIIGLEILVYRINNNFFGEHITVAGLLTSIDLYEQLIEKDLGETLFISKSMLRDGEEIFLDNILLCDLEKKLNISIKYIENNGEMFYNAFI